MANIYSMPLLAVILLVYLATVKVCVAELVLHQVDSANTSMQWVVKGLATYIVGNNPQTYLFYCTSTINNGNGVSWSRQGATLQKSQTAISKGSGLVFAVPLESDAGIYICEDLNSNDRVSVNITTANPAVLATASKITAILGDTVSIEFYASAIPEPTNMILWYHDSTEITSGSFSTNRRVLTIFNVTFADEGQYTFNVSTVTAVTKLIVLAPPKFVTHPTNISNILEWDKLTLNCTVNGSLPLVINWYKMNGNIPQERAIIKTHNIGNTTVFSELTINDARVSDSGLYRCNSSFTNGNHLVESEIATVTVKDNIRLVYTKGDETDIVVSLLFYTSSLLFTIECQGSGYLWWTNPVGYNVSLNSSSTPYQQTTVTSFATLNFTNYMQHNEGVYTCCSSSGAKQSLYITNDNPAVYTTMSNIYLTTSSFTNTSIAIYTSGSNPKPTADNITWYFNNNNINSSQNYYHLDSNNTVLYVSGFGDDIVGLYEARVMTVQGSNSIFVNVSYTKLPVVNIKPSVYQLEVTEGDNVTLICNATSDLHITISWEYEHFVVYGLHNDTLVIGNIHRNQSGTYKCVVFDGIRNTTDSIQLLVKYAPVVGIELYGNVTYTLMTLTLTENEIPDTIINCVSIGYPIPTVMWALNGNQSLPSGVIQNETLLQWTRPAVYSDEGQYYCIGNNTVNTSFVILYINFNVTPNIYSIFPVYPMTLYDSTNITYNCPEFPCKLNCIASGWPIPSLHWIDSTGNILNQSVKLFGTNGIAMASLELYSVVQPMTLTCKGENVHGIILQTVNVIFKSNVTPTQTIIPKLTNNKMRLRLLTNTCLQPKDKSWQKELVHSLRQVLLSMCPYCNNRMLISNSTCDNTSSTIVILTFESFNVTQLLIEWWNMEPTILLNQTLYVVDTNCNIHVRDDANLNCELQRDIPTPTLTIDTTDITELVAFIVGLCICSILIVVVLFSTIAVCYYWCNKHKANEDINNRRPVYINEIEAPDTGVEFETALYDPGPKRILQTTQVTNDQTNNDYDEVHVETMDHHEYAQLQSSPTTRVINIPIVNEHHYEEVFNSDCPSYVVPVYQDHVPNRPKRESDMLPSERTLATPYVEPTTNTYSLPINNKWYDDDDVSVVQSNISLQS